MQKPVQIDELWFGEYVEFGWVDLIDYLVKHARFCLYLLEHHLLEEEEPL